MFLGIMNKKEKIQKLQNEYCNQYGEDDLRTIFLNSYKEVEYVAAYNILDCVYNYSNAELSELLAARKIIQEEYHKRRAY